MSTKTTTAVDLHAALLEALAAKELTPEVRWAPSGNYASLLVDEKNIGYVFKQTRGGVRVEPAAQPADLPKAVKLFKPGKRSEQFGLVGVVTTAAEAKQAAAALAIAAAKQAKKRAANEAPAATKAPRKRGRAQRADAQVAAELEANEAVEAVLAPVDVEPQS